MPRVLLLDAITTHRLYFFFQAEDGIRDLTVTGVQTCALPISGDRTPSCPGPTSSCTSDHDRRGPGAPARPVARPGRRDRAVRADGAIGAGRPWRALPAPRPGPARPRGPPRAARRGGRRTAGHGQARPADPRAPGLAPGGGAAGPRPGRERHLGHLPRQRRVGIAST